jgi:hypothetical protein
MSEETIEKVSGSGEVVNPTHGATEGPPAAHTAGILWETRIKWFQDPRPNIQDDGPHSLDPYWEITDYTTEELNAFLEADELSPDLAERYRDYLGD